MSRLTTDNRDMGEQEEYYIARIEALRRRVKELEDQVESRRFQFTQKIVVPRDWPFLGKREA